MPAWQGIKIQRVSSQFCKRGASVSQPLAPMNALPAMFPIWGLRGEFPPAGVVSWQSGDGSPRAARNQVSTQPGIGPDAIQSESYAWPDWN